MIILPAVDIKGGRCVRLVQGRADDCKVYSADPVEAAVRWQKEGATWLHIVDLDGAFQGKPVNRAIIREMIHAISIPAEVGGGLRTDQDVREILDAGASRAIIGTRAVGPGAKLAEMVRLFGDALAVGIDARNGKVQVSGWVETTEFSATELALHCSEQGVRTLICTDTARDGMLKGVNVAAMTEMCRRVQCDVIASGGVTSVGDVQALLAAGCGNLVGAIVGKALYEGGVTLSALQQAAGSPDRRTAG